MQYLFRLPLTVAFVLWCECLLAFAPFKVKSIEVEGLQRVSLGTVLTYLPVEVGSEVSEQNVPQIIRALYSAGSFDEVSVEQQNGVLKIIVKERPTIASISFTGNDEFKTDDLKQALSGIGLKEGEILNRAMLSRVKNEIQQQYFARGQYSMDLKTILNPLPRNRIDIKFVVREGEEATISKINIIGNQHFDEETLLDTFELTDKENIWTFWETENLYSKPKLSGDLEGLRSFYMDRGYIRFSLVSTQVTLSPNRQHVYLTLVIDEGEQYQVESVDIAGNMVVPKSELDAITAIADKSVFSQKTVTQVEEFLSRRLSRDGYSFAKIKTEPEIDDASRQVKLHFFIDPGKRVYVRRINFTGNTKTSDEVLRREMRQMEGAWYNVDLVDLSKERIERLGYFESVEVETNPVPGTDDQIDVNLSVKEAQFGQFVAGIGFGQGTGLSFNASVTQENFMGTGKKVSFAVNKSRAVQSLNFSYTNPYYTEDGVSRGFSFFYKETDYSKLDTVSSSSDSWGGSMSYGYPLSEKTRLNFSVGYTNTDLNIFSETPSIQINDFFTHFEQDIRQDPSLAFDSITMNGSWIYNSLNRGVFPTSGARQIFSTEVSTPLGDLTYYKLEYNAQTYWQLDRKGRWALGFRSGLGYGDGYGDYPDGYASELPYFESFYLGGRSALRGFKHNRLGPREIFRVADVQPGLPNSNGFYDLSGSNNGPQYDDIRLGNSIGGNLRLTAGLEFIFPTPFLENERSFRSSWFVDAGGLWDTHFNRDAFADLTEEQQQEIPDFSDYGRIRVSTGVTFQWLSPLGPISFTLAKPVRQEEGDQTDFFEFGIGRTF